MITPEEVLTNVAGVVRGIEGIESAWYPIPDSVPASPFGVVYWGGLQDDTSISYGMGAEEWTMPFLVRVLIRHQEGMTPAELGKIDRLLQRIQDTFSPVRTLPNILMPGLSGPINACHVTGLRPSQETTFQNVECYAGDALFIARFRRVFP